MDSKNKIRTWSIRVLEDGTSYSVTHGLLGGSQQETLVEVTSGKNLGKANATTPQEQCRLDAESDWRKQKDRKGYTEHLPTTQPNLPMLAHPYAKHKDKVKFPAIVSIKLDGCLSSESLIKTKEFGYKTIKHIVDNKLDCSVSSLNTKTGKIEYKKVVNYFCNRQVEEVSWYEIETIDGNKLRLTGNHKVFLPELACWRRVDELTGDEKLMEY